jgi:hypothetical protein
MFYSKENHMCYELQYQEYCSPLRIDLALENNTLCKSWIPVVKRIIFFHVCLFIFIEETHGSLETKPFVVEAEASSTLFPCEH